MDERPTDHRSDSIALPILLAVLLCAVVIVAGGAVGLGFIQFRSREHQLQLDAQRARQAAIAAEEAAEFARIRQHELEEEAKMDADETPQSANGSD